MRRFVKKIMEIPLWIYPVVVSFIALDIYLVYLVLRRRKFSPEFHAKIVSHLQKVRQMPMKDQILEFDKILDQCLLKKGLFGTLGDKMKRYNKYFLNKDAVWKAHKLRNKLAHEIDYHLTEKEFFIAEMSYRKEIEALLK